MSGLRMWKRDEPPELYNDRLKLQPVIVEELPLDGPDHCEGVTYENFHLTLFIARYQSESWRPGVELYLRVRTYKTEWYQIPSHILKVTIDDLLALPDMALFAIFFELYKVQDGAYDQGMDNGRHEVMQAFVNGTLKKRKRPGQNHYKVWIERKPTDGLVQVEATV